jgi:hypothetical protein
VEEGSASKGGLKINVTSSVSEDVVHTIEHFFAEGPWSLLQQIDRYVDQETGEVKRTRSLGIKYRTEACCRNYDGGCTSGD